jgi:signal transduction histidine kinase
MMAGASDDNIGVAAARPDMAMATGFPKTAVLRGQRTINFSRAVLATIYVLASFGFPDQFSALEHAERITLLIYAAVAIATLGTSYHSWILEAIFRPVVLIVDWLVFFVLIAVTGVAQSAYLMAAAPLMLFSITSWSRRHRALLPLFVTLGYASVSLWGLQLPSESESVGELTLLNILHLSLIGFATVLLLDGRWAVAIRQDAKIAAQDSGLPRETMAEYAIAATKCLFGAQQAWMIANTDGRVCRLAIGPNGVTVSMKWSGEVDQAFGQFDDLKMMTAQFAGTSFSLVQARDRIFRPVLRRASPSMRIIHNEFGINESVLIVLHALKFDARILLVMPEQLSEANLQFISIARPVIEIELAKLESQLMAASVTKQNALLEFSNDLHDSAVQSLAAIRLHASIIAQSDSVAAVVKRAKNISLIAANESQRLRKMMVPTGPNDELMAPLVASLQLLTTQLSSEWDIECTFNAAANDATEDLGALCDAPNLLYNLSNFIREAISNSVRHGGATRICVGLAAKDDQLHLIIQDNASASGPVKRSKSLSTRAKKMGASFTIETAEDGVVISLLIHNEYRIL